jgi:hypothetical protein
MMFVLLSLLPSYALAEHLYETAINPSESTC